MPEPKHLTMLGCRKRFMMWISLFKWAFLTSSRMSVVFTATNSPRRSIALCTVPNDPLRMWPPTVQPFNPEASDTANPCSPTCKISAPAVGDPPTVPRADGDV
eukprot:CAMPEP_0115250878 /NCGR_PEP_ID=MMETSP0270-20121206/43340_1 /TAXON_ID=71861 /ORGANISM="Scrippsiella trochoidea, Strain CCMP3099" /LENGTH=102 /DNA_ID=CAMNT_0002666279 /DNA_START=642 /DNA_END=950 /DNA_ORIENTATION=+